MTGALQLIGTTKRTLELPKSAMDGRSSHRDHSTPTCSATQQWRTSDLQLAVCGTVTLVRIHAGSTVLLVPASIPMIDLRLRFARRVYAALLALAFTLPASATQEPQWTVTVSNDVPPVESTFLRDQRPWDALPDGGAIVLSFDSLAYYVRNLDARGQVRSVARGDFGGSGVSYYQLSSAILRRHPQGGALALLGDGTNCALVRADARGAILWERLPGQNLPYANPCRDLHVLPDGSALVLRQSSLVRVDADGNSVWTVSNGGGRYFSGNDFAVDASDVIWVASRGGETGNSNVAAVLRFRLDGVRLGEDLFLCGTCVYNATLGIGLLSGGDVVAVGAGQLGFVARYAPDGTRRYLKFGEPGVNHGDVVVDGQDRVYARSESPTYSLRRLDPEDGNVLWTRPGETLAAMPDGIVTTLVEGPNNSQRTAVAYDAAGDRVWARVLASGNSDRIGAALADAGGVSLLLLTWLADQQCGRSPAVVRLDLAGMIVGMRKACATPGSTYARAVHAVKTVGVLSDLQSGLVAHTPSGKETWRLPVCNGCDPYGPATVHRTPAKLRADGGAWAVRGTITSYSPTAQAIERLDALGRVVAAAPLMVTGIPNSSVVLINSPDHAWALMPQSGRLSWQRVANDGTVVANGSALLPIYAAYVSIADAKPNADGGFTVALRHSPGQICTNRCPPVYSVFLRTRPDGTEAWRHQPSLINGTGIVDRGGGAWHVRRDDASNNEMQHISGEGMLAVPIALPGLVGQALKLAGPFRNRMFISTSNALFGVDTDGANLTTRSGEMALLGADAGGVLVREYFRHELEAQWLDPATLQSVNEFDLPSFTDTSTYSPGVWTVVDGAIAYGIKGVIGEDDLTRATLMRFNLPGASADVLFADGFE